MSGDKNNIQDNVTEIDVTHENNSGIDTSDIKEIPAEPKASKPTTVNILDDDNYDHINETFEERKNDIPETDAPASEDYEMTEEDVLELSEFFFEAFDTGVCFGLSVYSGDTAQSQFGIEEKRKKRLIKMLAAIIVKHKLFLRIEFVFIIALVFAYSSSFRRAHQTRKERKAKKPSKSEPFKTPSKAAQEKSAPPKEEKETKNGAAFTIITEEKKSTSKESEAKTQLSESGEKRKRGRPSKYAPKTN